MSSNADRTIAALSSGHDRMVAQLRGLAPGAIEGRSGSSEWTVAQVLSHLGSGAEITIATLDTSLDGAPAVADDFNQGVWSRWDAKTPQEQADDFVCTNGELVRRFEAIDRATLETAKIDLGFLPEPIDVATAAGFRLNEFALHGWDVAVASDPGATLAPESVEPLLGIAPIMLGWIGKPDVLDDAVTVAVTLTDLDQRFGLQIDDAVSFVEVPAEPGATLDLPAESWVRLLYGRLAPGSTPAGVQVTGAVTLDELREVFPGF